MIDRNTKEIVATGRRKRAVARVRIKQGSGKFEVNGRKLEDYLAREVLVRIARQPLVLTGTDGMYDVRVICDGGGLSGQAGAIRHGLARALLEANPNLKQILRSYGLLTRDPREVERKKYGRPGARKRFQFSKR
ncbi:MAG: 30S ribosomal protein S9 [Candidatus Hydrogenedentes bacterium]|nr:30S ribosomal protein S9 [Candidatus Hydrogenedentota bacterium]